MSNLKEIDARIIVDFGPDPVDRPAYEVKVIVADENNKPTESQDARQGIALMEEAIMALSDQIQAMSGAPRGGTVH